MLARIRKAQEENEGGFTLIELLVVIIIIGILAAIAIPTFLRQREKGWLAAVKSDVKNVTTAEESYATDHEGAYTDDVAGDLEGSAKEGYNESTDVTVTATLTNDDATAYTLCGSHAKLPDKSVTFDSTTGKTEVVDAACGAA